jgi:hypothetical protein
MRREPHPVEHAEDRRVGADPQPERQHRYRREPRRAPHATHGIPRILKEFLYQPHIRINGANPWIV